MKKKRGIITVDRQSSVTLFYVMEPDSGIYWKRVRCFSVLQAARDWAAENGYEIESENL